ncbi:Protein ABHD14B-like [Oopsacas minuta]|uniref:Protein ABHD14B-like n=1 Tax=Oopsacas minuta TaxID=111878 RepID=A0AAV7JZW7_9METZ|nr:Protein ABHD14B-like [Oopsacas minuta]
MKRIYYISGILIVIVCISLYILKLTRFALHSNSSDNQDQDIEAVSLTDIEAVSLTDIEAVSLTDIEAVSLIDIVSPECSSMLKNLHVEGSSELVANSHQGDVLLLHGAAFTSETWKSISTIKILSAQGFRVIAVDLPGYGKTPALTADDPSKDKFIGCVLEKFELDHPFLVAPSMSGEYAIPFVLEHFQQLAGFVPIAPTTATSIDPNRYERISLPTLILYGSQDKAGQEVSKKYISKIPQSTIYEVSNAGHPCYMDNPKEFHVQLVKFLMKYRRRN